MNNDNSRAFESLTENYRQIRRRLPNKIATTAVNFFKRNFRVGGFQDTPFKKWKDPQKLKKERKTKKGNTTLIESGNLRRGIKKISAKRNSIVVGISKNIPYAQIHNEGGKIPRKNGKTTEMPQRQFIGDSDAIETALNRTIIKELKKLQP